MRKGSFNIEEPVRFEAIYCGSLVFCEKNTSLFKTLFDQQRELTPCLVSKHSLSPPTLSLSLCLCLSFSLKCMCTHTHTHTCTHACMHTILFLHLYKYAWIIVTEEVVYFWWTLLWLIRLSKWLFSVHIYRYAGAVTVWLMRLSIWLFSVHIYRHAGAVTEWLWLIRLSNWLCFQFTCTSIQGLSHSVVLCVGSLSPTGRVNVFTCANTLGSDLTCKLLLAKFPCGLLVGKASAGWPLSNATD